MKWTKTQFISEMLKRDYPELEKSQLHVTVSWSFFKTYHQLTTYINLHGTHLHKSLALLGNFSGNVLYRPSPAFFYFSTHFLTYQKALVSESCSSFSL